MIPGGGEVDLPRLRQGLYRFLAAALLPPQQTRFAQLGPAAGLLEGLGVDAFAFAQPWLEMREAIEAAPSLLVLQAEYVHLFESGSDGALCPPLESFYVASPRHGGPAVVAADLEVEYQRLGMTIADGVRLDGDHISPQLELMAQLCDREAMAAEVGDLQSVIAWSQEQRQFTDSHLARWVPRFATRVRAEARPGLYRSLVVTLDAFVDHDREMLHVLDRHERTGSRS